MLKVLSILNRLKGLRSDFHRELTTDWLLFQPDSVIVGHIKAVRRTISFLFDDAESVRNDIDPVTFKSVMDAISIAEELLVYKFEEALKRQIVSNLN